MRQRALAVTRKDDFANKVRRSLRTLQTEARKIISYFRKPSRKYAARIRTSLRTD
jgi:hypothetical protein